jgi:hypothetical protein
MQYMRQDCEKRLTTDHMRPVTEQEKLYSKCVRLCSERLRLDSKQVRQERLD